MNIPPPPPALNLPPPPPPLNLPPPPPPLNIPPPLQQKPAQAKQNAGQQAKKPGPTIQELEAKQQNQLKQQFQEKKEVNVEQLTFKQKQELLFKNIPLGQPKGGPQMPPPQQKKPETNQQPQIQKQVITQEQVVVQQKIEIRESSKQQHETQNPPVMQIPTTNSNQNNVLIQPQIQPQSQSKSPSRNSQSNQLQNQQANISIKQTEISQRNTIQQQQVNQIQSSNNNVNQQQEQGFDLMKPIYPTRQSQNQQDNQQLFGNNIQYEVSRVPTNQQNYQEQQQQQEKRKSQNKKKMNFQRQECINQASERQSTSKSIGVKEFFGVDMLNQLKGFTFEDISHIEAPELQFKQIYFNTHEKMDKNNINNDYEVIKFSIKAEVTSYLDSYIVGDCLSKERQQIFKENLQKEVEKMRQSKVNDSSVDLALLQRVKQGLIEDLNKKTQQMQFEECIKLRDVINLLDETQKKIDLEQNPEKKKQRIKALNTSLIQLSQKY